MKNLGIGVGQPKHDVSQTQVAEHAQIQSAATRGAQALVKMPDADRDAVMGQLPGLVRDIASQVVGGPLDNHLLKRKKDQLARLIEQGGNSISGATLNSGDSVAKLRIALTDDSSLPQVVAKTAAALALIAHRAGATVEQFDALVGRLELLADLQGKKSLGMISNRALKAKIVALTNGNLEELARAVGKELAVLAYEPVRRAAVSQEVV